MLILGRNSLTSPVCVYHQLFHPPSINSPISQIFSALALALGLIVWPVWLIQWLRFGKSPESVARTLSKVALALFGGAGPSSLRMSNAPTHSLLPRCNTVVLTVLVFLVTGIPGGIWGVMFLSKATFGTIPETDL